MNTKHYMVISGIMGGVIGSLLTALLVPPVTAEQDKFGEIECRKLTVIGDAGKPLIELNAEHRRGSVCVYHEDDDFGYTCIGVSSHLRSNYGGFVNVVGKNGEMAELSIAKHGGYVGVITGDGQPLAAVGVKQMADGRLKGSFGQWPTKVK